MVATDSWEAQEILQSFQMMAPLMRHLRPTLDENDAKRPRGQHRGHAPDQVVAPPAMNAVLSQLTKLCLQLDSDIQHLKTQDSFVIFMATSSEAILPSMMKEAGKWKIDREAQKTHGSLRQTLTSYLFQELLNRVTQLSKCKPTDPAWKLAVERNLLDSNGCWLYSKWNPSTQSLVVDNRTPIKMDQMINWLTELVEACTDQHWVIRFHSLRSDDVPIVPWRLQVSLRHHEAFRLLQMTCNCQVWQTLGTTFRSHHQLQSPAANQLRLLTGKGQGKGKAKSKPKHRPGQTSGQDVGKPLSETNQGARS